MNPWVLIILIVLTPIVYESVLYIINYIVDNREERDYENI